ncbi:MAG: 30S ribosomal protein S6 [Gaiellaceae bacterium]
MTDYEVMIMLDPELAEDRQQEIIDRVRAQVVEGGGVWEAHAPWGRRRLAYEILHRSEGIYHLVTFAATPEVLNEVSRLLKIDDSVLRHLAVRRVKGSSIAVPAPAPAPAAASVEPVAAEPSAVEVEIDSVQEDE